MPKTKTTYAFAFAAGLTLAFGSIGAYAQSEDAANTLKIGYAGITFNTKSGHLIGPPGTTPPGIQTDLRDARTFALIYERRISGPWSVVVQAATPPVVKVDGAGTGAPLGSVETTKAWFPAVLATYTFAGLPGIRPYVGAGVNYAFFTDPQVSAAYTGAFGGTSSSSTLKNSWGARGEARRGIPYREELGSRRGLLALLDQDHGHHHHDNTRGGRHCTDDQCQG